MVDPKKISTGNMLAATSPNIETAPEEMIQNLQSGIAHQHLMLCKIKLKLDKNGRKQKENT